MENDAPVLRAISREYEQARLVRICRLQRAAAEGCGLPELRDKLRAAAGVTNPQERVERMREMSKWLDK
jgi:hypothetical protein